MRSLIIKNKVNQMKDKSKVWSGLLALTIGMGALSSSPMASELQNPAPLENHRESRLKSLLQPAKQLYEYKKNLETTKTFQSISWLDTLVLTPGWSLYTKGVYSAGVKLGMAFGINTNLGLSLVGRFVDRFAPDRLKPFCHRFLESPAITLAYQLYNNAPDFILSNTIGLLGIGAAHAVTDLFGVEQSPARLECEAFAYYCLKRASWEYAEDILGFFSSVSEEVLKSVLTENPMGNRTFSSMPQDLPTTPVPFDVQDCKTDVCRIEQGWQDVKRCIQGAEPNLHGDAWPECRFLYKKQIPTFERNMGDELYSGIKKIGQGAEHIVVEAVLKQERPQFNIKEGDKIAIKFRQSGGSGIGWDLEAYSRLEMAHQYTNSFLDIYGIYVGSYHGVYKIFGESKAGQSYLEYSKKNPEMITPLYVEMDYVPYSFFNGKPGTVPDSVLFELCIGEWSLGAIAGIKINDEQGRHFVYKISDSLRTYEIGGKTFLIKENIIPKRIDYDDVAPVKLQCDRRSLGDVCPVFTLFENKLSDPLKNFYSNYSKKLGVFPFLFKAFKDYEISDEDFQALKQNKSIKLEHYKLPEELLPPEVWKN
jgi:hypothetical protein